MIDRRRFLQTTAGTALALAGARFAAPPAFAAWLLSGEVLGAVQ